MSGPTTQELAEEILILKRRVTILEGQKSAPASGGSVANDADLDGEWGDPVVRYGLKEKYWKEQPDPYIGCRFSECPPEYLDATVKYLDACAYMFRKDGGAEKVKKATYKERDAARARGWAERHRKNGGPVATQAEAAAFGGGGGGGGDDEIPFIVNELERPWQP